MRKKGFTLIELLTSLAIASILILTSYMIFGTSINASKKTFTNELEFKSTSVGFTYIENIIRNSYKIEITEDNGESNCKFYIINKAQPNSDQEISTYRFLTDISKSSNEKTLFAEITNISNQVLRNTKVPISKCDDLYLYFDVENERVKIIINKDNPRLRYETLINVGKRL